MNIFWFKTLIQNKPKGMEHIIGTGSGHIIIGLDTQTVDLLLTATCTIKIIT